MKKLSFILLTGLLAACSNNPETKVPTDLDNTKNNDTQTVIRNGAEMNGAADSLNRNR